MTDKEQIIIDGVEVLKEKINMCFILLLNKLETPETIEQTIYEHLDAFVKEWNAQLARKTQEYEQLQEKYEALKLENQEGYEIVAELKHECEELNRKYKNVLNLAKQNADANEYCLQELEQENIRYSKALEEIKKVLSHCVMTGAIVKILYIINKAKGEENAI